MVWPPYVCFTFNASCMCAIVAHWRSRQVEVRHVSMGPTFCDVAYLWVKSVYNIRHMMLRALTGKKRAFVDHNNVC